MDQPLTREAIYWRAFALIALVNKRNISDFEMELARSSAGMFVSDGELEAILNEYYPELGRILMRNRRSF